jgi:hypothetical protein
MSNTARWIIAIILILFGLAAGLFAVFGGAFSTVACVQTPPDWVYYVLLGTGVLTLAGAVVPAVMLIRRAKGMWVVIAIIIGIVVSCLGYTIYLTVLGQTC